MKRFAVSGLLLAHVLAHASQGTIDLVLPAQSLERTVARIAESTGSKLSVAPALKGEIVVVRAKSAQAEELLARLAEVADAVWSDRPGGERQLVPRVRPRSDAALRQRAGEMRAWLQRMLRPRPTRNEGQDGKDPAIVEDPSASWMPGDATGTRALLRLAASVDPMRLADVGPYGRVVYSNRPTRSQLPLSSPETPKIIAEWIRERNAWFDRLKEAGRADAARAKTPDEVLVEQAIAQYGAMFGASEPAQRIEGNVKVNLVVREGSPFAFIDPSSGQLSLELLAYDSVGKMVARASVPFRMSESKTTRERIERESKPLEGKPIEFSPLAREFARLVDWSDPENFGQKEPSPALAERLMRPDLHDPLSFIHSEALLAAAEAKGTSMVACLPDSVVSSLDFGMPGSSTTVEAVVERLTHDASLVCKEESGWWTIAPAAPADARSTRLDRVALAALIRASSSKALTSLDDLAAYAAKNEPPTLASIAMPYFVTYVSGATRFMMGGNDWQMLRLYAMLGPSARQTLAQGASISLAALGPSASELVRRMAFGPEARLDVKRADQAPRDPWLEMIADYLPMPQVDYLDEPTESLANGIPPDAVIEMTVVKEPVALPLNDGGAPLRLFGALSSTDMAMMRAAMLADEDGAAGMFKRVKMGSQQKFQIRVRLTPQVGLRAELRDPSIEADAPAIDVAKLPAEFEKLVADRVKRFEDHPLRHLMQGAPPKTRP